MGTQLRHSCRVANVTAAGTEVALELEAHRTQHSLEGVKQPAAVHGRSGQCRQAGETVGNERSRAPRINETGRSGCSIHRPAYPWGFGVNVARRRERTRGGRVFEVEREEIVVEVREGGLVVKVVDGVVDAEGVVGGGRGRG